MPMKSDIFIFCKVGSAAVAALNLFAIFFINLVVECDWIEVFHCFSIEKRLKNLDVEKRGFRGDSVSEFRFY